jgi:hypothetical protein
MYLEGDQEECWWWKPLWKLKAPLKSRIFFWLALSNKALTWKVLQRRVWQGPGFCVLCKANGDNINYILMDCSFSKKLWKKVYSLRGGLGSWEGTSLIEGFKKWIEDSLVANHKALPCVVSWAL